MPVMIPWRMRTAFGDATKSQTSCLSTRTDDPKLVDATVVVATYQIKG